uniref:Uncharacterized protein n=1 Tax=Oryza brachyantha TaxID=4533 RepID=J3LLC7_ORYBR
MNAIEWELAAHQENEEGNNSVDDFFSKWYFPISTLYFRQESQKRPDKMQYPKATSHLFLRSRRRRRPDAEEHAAAPQPVDPTRRE